MTGTITLGSHDVAAPVAQRLLVWAKHDKRVSVSHDNLGRLVFRFPNDVFVAQYGAALKLSDATTVTVAATGDFVAAADWQTVSGIDPNDHTTASAAPGDLAAAAVTGQPGAAVVTWTATGHHRWFRLRYRLAATTDPAAPAGAWHNVDIPGYRRQHVVTGITDPALYEFFLQGVADGGTYVPILSEVATIDTGGAGFAANESLLAAPAARTTRRRKAAAAPAPEPPAETPAEEPAAEPVDAPPVEEPTDAAAALAAEVDATSDAAVTSTVTARTAPRTS